MSRLFPPELSSGRVRNGLRAPASAAFGLLAVLIAGMTVGAPAAAQETLEVAPAPVTFEDPAIKAATEALVLLNDNQKRVFAVHPGVAALRIMTQEKSPSVQDTAHTAMQAQASLKITAQLVSDASFIPSGNPLKRMQNAQEALMKSFGSQGASSDSVDGRVSGLVQVFAKAEAAARSRLNVPTELQYRIILSYEKEIAAVTQSMIDQVAYDGGGGGSGGYERDDNDPPISAEEYAEKQERYAEWLRERQSYEAEVKRLREERTRERLEREKRSQSRPANRPKVGIRQQAMAKPMPERPKAAMIKKMAVWHIHWSRQSEAIKKALAKTLKLDFKRRSTKSISTCRHLFQSVTAVSADPVVMSPPDSRAKEALNEALTELEALALTCSQGELEKTREHREKSRQALGRTMEILGIYDLKLFQ